MPCCTELDKELVKQQEIGSIHIEWMYMKYKTEKIKYSYEMNNIQIAKQIYEE